jgi:TRAP-type C4-dicarboxylate transport system substrate-binding protein
MMRKVSVLVFLAFLFAWCMKATAAEQITLKFATWHGPTSPNGLIEQELAKMLEEKTKGAVKIKFFWSESLVKYVETYRAVQTGVADMIYYVVGACPGVHILNEVVNLPFMGFPSMEKAGPIYEKLLQEIPELRAEWKGVKLFRPRFMAGSHIHTTKKQVKLPPDLKGMRLIASGPMVFTVETLGGAPVQLGMGDWYTSLERGLVEGHATHYPVILMTKTIDLLHYHLDFGPFGFYAQPDMLVMNMDTWNKLPKNFQEIIEDLCSNWRVAKILKVDMGEIEKAKAYAKQKGHTFYYATPQEVSQWKEALKPVVEKWIETAESKGLPGRKVYNEATRIIKATSGR